MLIFSKIPLNNINIQEIIKYKAQICFGSHITLSLLICMLIYKSLGCLILVFCQKSSTVAPLCNIYAWVGLKSHQYLGYSASCFLVILVILQTARPGNFLAGISIQIAHIFHCIDIHQCLCPSHLLKTLFF